MVNELILCYGMQDDINNEKHKQSCSDFFFSKGGFRTKLLMEFGATLSMIHTCDQQRTVVWQQCHQTLWLSIALANVSRMEKDLPFYPHVHGWWLLIIYMYEVCFSVTLNPVTVNITLWFIVALRANTKWYMRLKVFNKPHSFRHTVNFRENMAK